MRIMYGTESDEQITPMKVASILCEDFTIEGVKQLVVYLQAYLKIHSGEEVQDE